MKILHKIDRYYWAVLALAISVGFVYPQFLKPFESAVVWIISSILFLVFLKVDVAEIFHHIKRPFLMIYLIAVNMLAIPAIIHYLFLPIDPEMAVGLLLLAALPAGVSSAAFTDIMDGHTSLTLTIVILTTLVAPFTIPLLFLMIYNTTIPVDYSGLFVNLLQVLMIPLVISQIFKNIAGTFVDHSQKYINALVIILLSTMIMVVIALKSEYILQNVSETISTLGYLYVAFIIIQLLGYFSVYWLQKGAKVAVSNSNVIMNNILGVVLALAFFGPKVELLIVLSIIPWNTMIIVFHWYKRYLP